MNNSTIPLFLCCLLLFGAKGLAKTENEKIRDYLKTTLDNSNYEKRIAPEGSSGPGSPVNVEVTMYILDISRVDENCKEFDAQFFFRQTWNDTRLRVQDSHFNGVTLREVDRIWTPDLFFVNEKEGSLNKMIQPNTFCRITSKGNVFYSVRVTERLSCSMDLRKYPLDVQKCNVRAESYGYTRRNIELKWAPGTPVGASPNITADDFELVEVVPEVKYSNFTSGIYSTLEVHFKLQRKFGYFARKLYAPFTILVLLSWLSLWIKAKEKYLRLALLLVILYLMVTIASELEVYTPNTPYTTASDVWIGFCEAMVFAAFLEFIAVCIISNEAEETGTRTKADILSIDLEAKENNLSAESLKSTLNKFLTMFDARNGTQIRRELPHWVDRSSRLMFPVIFIVFNIVYWSFYSSP